MLRTTRLTGAVRGRRTSVIFLGTALALAGAGTASAATLPSSSPAPSIAAMAARMATPLHVTAPVRLATADRTAARQHDAQRPASRPHYPRPTAAHPRAAAHRAGLRIVARPASAVHHTLTWAAVSSELNQDTNPVAAAHGILPAADRLLPAGTSGPQSSMPITPAQYANASTIVRQTLAKGMGIRSAVIAVATAMQESRLLNVNYGTGNSLGLFQQQWNMGWGSPQQIMNPAYASDAFLGALRTYQAGDPAWASQPLYQAAQGVQRSAFPYAYAQWEAQAAQLTAQIAMHLR